MTNPYPSSSPKPRRQLVLARIVICALIIGGAIFGARYLILNKPKAERKTPPKMTALVRVATVEPVSERVTVRVMGTVTPASEIVLRCGVSGEVVWTHPAFEPGACFRQGETLLRVDPEDYRLLVAQREADVVKAEADLQVERGRQKVAGREWQIMDFKDGASQMEESLALRQPQLKQADAALASARAQLAQARLNLARAEVKIPFNALVRTKSADAGGRVGTQDALATLVGTDEYWIQVSIPTDRLPWITLPGPDGKNGSPALIHVNGGPNAGQELPARQGAVRRLMADLNTEGRMARLLVVVANPLELDRPSAERRPLIIGDYVHVDIEGRRLENVMRLPRTALREGDVIWVAAPDDTLVIRPVTVAWRERDEVLLDSGLSAGDRVIVSDLGTPVAGMPLTIQTDRPATGTPAKPEPKAETPAGGDKESRP